MFIEWTDRHMDNVFAILLHWGYNNNNNIEKGISGNANNNAQNRPHFENIKKLNEEVSPMHQYMYNTKTNSVIFFFQEDDPLKYSMA